MPFEEGWAVDDRLGMKWTCWPASVRLRLAFPPGILAETNLKPTQHRQWPQDHSGNAPLVSVGMGLLPLLYSPRYAVSISFK